MRLLVGQARHDPNQGVQVDWLLEVVLKARSEGARPVLRSDEPSEGDGRGDAAVLRGQRTDLADQPIAALVWHLEVADDDIRTLMDDDLEHRVRGTDRRHRRATRLERRLEQRSDDSGVVDDQRPHPVETWEVVDPLVHDLRRPLLWPRSVEVSKIRSHWVFAAISSWKIPGASGRIF